MTAGSKIPCRNLSDAIHKWGLFREGRHTDLYLCFGGVLRYSESVIVGCELQPGT